MFEVILDKIKTFISYFEQTLGKFFVFVEQLLFTIFGKQRVTNFQSYFSDIKNNLKAKMYSHINPYGKYSMLITTIYKWFYRIVLGTLFFVFLLKTNFLWLTGAMPSIEQLQNPKLSQGSTIFSADGVEIGKFYTENRTPVDSASISPWVFKALIDTEDKRFFSHSGIDLKRMGSVVVGILSGQTDQGGGSTISQQLAKNLYNTRKKEMRGLFYYIPILRQFTYKTKEWLTAIELEKRFTKGEIATLYLNTVDYGNNAFGIKTAAKTYFNKTPDKLDISESSILVGLQKATTYYNPIKNPVNAKKRRNTVLQRMVAAGDLKADLAAKISKKDIVLDINLEDPNAGQGDYFKVALRKYLEKWAKTNDVDIDLYRDGLKIHTTIDSRMQNYAEDAVENHMKQLQREFDHQWEGKNPWSYENGQEIPGFIESVAKRTEIYNKLATKYRGKPDSVNYYMNKAIPMNMFSWDGNKKMDMSPMDSIRYYKKFLQAGMVAYDPYSGFIKAWVGGADFDHFKYDHVSQGRRQPGSSFKPVLYTAAVDGPLNLSPCDKRQDKKISIPYEENGVKKTWEPKNANGRFSGSNLTLRSALARSVNSVAVQLTQEVGPKTVVEYAQKMGIQSPIAAVNSVGLGTSDVTLLELASAYGVFLNEGLYREPIMVYKIEDSKGKVLFEFEPEVHEAIKPESAYLMQFILRGNVEEPSGTGHRLFQYPAIFQNGGQAAGKTGTTSNYSDSWYVGFTKDLVCGVWVGGDDRSIHFRGSLGEGGQSALPIFGIFMNKVYQDKSLHYTAGPFPKPNVQITKPYAECGIIDAPNNNSIDSLEYDPSADSVARYESRRGDTSVTFEKINTIRPRSDSSRFKREIKIE